MLRYPLIKCPRGLDTCRSYGQVVANEDDPLKGSFFCCGKNDGSMSSIPEDRYTKCFHGEFRNDMTFHDRRDLIDEMNVIASALSHIELDSIEELESKKGES